YSHHVAASVVLLSITLLLFLFFCDTATTAIYTLSLHDALPISTWLIHSDAVRAGVDAYVGILAYAAVFHCLNMAYGALYVGIGRSEEHTSELQSLAYLVCRLLLEKKKPSQ